MDYLAKYGSFISGLLGAAMVIGGAMIKIRTTQSKIMSLVESANSERQNHRQRMDALEGKQGMHRKELYEHIEAVQKHLHEDMKQLKKDFDSRVDRSEANLTRQLDQVHFGIAEIRNMLNQHMLARRKRDFQEN